MTTNQTRKTHYTRSDLIARGWLPEQVEALLPLAKVKKPKTKKKKRNPPSPFWDAETIADIESGDKFHSEKMTIYENSLQKLTDELDDASSQPNVLNFIATIDSNCRTLLKEVEKSCGQTKDNCIPYETYTALHNTVFELMLKIRETYISTFNTMHSYDISLPDDGKKPIQNIMFKAMVGDAIPDHPKDEFTLTRLMTRKFIIHSGGTNTGKTHHALEALKKKEKGTYLAPLRLLALQVCQQLNDAGFLCSLLTGEEEMLVPNAQYVSSTIEKMTLDEVYDVAIIDEAQMISDAQRGSAWTAAVLGVRADEVHVCCSSNAVRLITRLIEECGDEFEIIEYERDIPLLVDKGSFLFPKNVQDGDALIAFSKKMVLGIASYLADNGIASSIIYGDLPPETRRKQVEAFINKETSVVVSTDAIGMGLNLPIKRIVFMENSKYDGYERRLLNAAEVKQIAGRAGRKNIYDVGYVNAISDKAHIGKLLDAELSNLNTAYYLPLDKYILSMPLGTLKQRLVEAMIKVSKISPFRGANIEQALKLFGLIKTEYNLSMSEQHRLIFLPFDVENPILMSQWIEYIKAYVGKKEIVFPEYEDSNHLGYLEIHYQKLSLYYSFCKAMHIHFDNERVIQAKLETADKIHTLLIAEVKAMGRKCSQCNSRIPWNHQYGICQNCYMIMRAERRCTRNRYYNDYD